MIINNKILATDTVIHVRRVSESRLPFFDRTATVHIEGPRYAQGNMFLTLESIFGYICKELRQIFPYDTISLVELEWQERGLCGKPLIRSFHEDRLMNLFEINKTYPTSYNMGICYSRVANFNNRLSIYTIPNLPKYLSNTYNISLELLERFRGNPEAVDYFKRDIPLSSATALAEGVFSSNRFFFSVGETVYMLVLSNRLCSRTMPLIRSKTYAYLYSMIDELKVLLKLQIITERKNLEIQNKVNESIKKIGSSLALLSKARDEETGEHLERIEKKVYAILMVLERNNYQGCQVSDGEKELLLSLGGHLAANACQLHDIGKMNVVDSILKKTGSLTEEEYSEIQRHVQYGQNFISEKAYPLCTNVAEISYYKLAEYSIAEHHERFDGLGYPQHISGSDIHLIGRVTKLVDVHDALSHKRHYKPAFPKAEVNQFIIDNAGREFDPALVALLFNPEYKLLDVFSEIDSKYGD